MLLAAALAAAVLAQNPPVPTVTTGAAESVTTNSAVVGGTVNPNGAATTYHVEYGTTAAYGLATGNQDAGAGTDPVAVKVTLTKLTQDTTYHYRLVATNAAGTVGGTDRTLHTARAPAAPIASTRPATQKGPLSAVVNGLITPRGLPTTMHFVFGPTSSYGSQTWDCTTGSSWSGNMQPTGTVFHATFTDRAGNTRSVRS